MEFGWQIDVLFGLAVIGLYAVMGWLWRKLVELGEKHNHRV